MSNSIGSLQNQAGGQAAQHIHNALNSPQNAMNQNSQNMLGAQQPSVIDRILAWRKRAKAKDEVLEYLQAQLNMDLFKGDWEKTQLFNTAMNAAMESIIK